MFFSIIATTTSRWGTITELMQLGSAKYSLNYWRYVCLSDFSLTCLVSSSKSSGVVHAWTFLRKWSINYQNQYLNSREMWRGSLPLCAWLVVVLLVVPLAGTPLAVVLVGTFDGPPLINNEYLNLYHKFDVNNDQKLWYKKWCNFG